MAAPVGWEDLMQFMMQESEARREESAQHRLEMTEREQARRLELEGLRMEMGGRPRERMRETPRLTKMEEGGDVEAYLTTFECVMTVYEVPKDRWSFTLAPQLIGKAQQAYAAMDNSHIDDYVEVKAAILRRYAITEETYRQRFRTIRKSGNETYVELMVRLRDLANKWMRNCKSVEAVIEKLVVEQFMDGLPPQLRVWMLERRLTSMEEVGLAADDYVGAQRYGVVTRGHAQMSRDNPSRDNPSRWYQDGDAEGSSAGNERRAGGESIRKCYGCGGVGHYKRECQRLTRNGSEMGGPGSKVRNWRAGKN